MHKILVVGDIIIDEYWHGVVTRISPEAPVPIVEIDKREWRPGGATNVGANIRSLGEECRVIGVVGPELQEEYKNSEEVVIDETRRTTVKTRIVAGTQQIVRLDYESHHPISSEVALEVIRRIRGFAEGACAIVLSDYAKGVLTDEVIRCAINEGIERNIPVIVDPKRTDFSIYHGASLITPNEAEFEKATNADTQTPILVTMGARGMVLKKHGNNAVHIPTMAREVVDVTGAGDTVVAALAVYIVRFPGCRLEYAAEFANSAAAVAVSKQGTVAVRLSEMDVNQEILTPVLVGREMN